MDLRAYYRKIREVECTIQTPYVIVIGLDTSDGGRAGTTSEASRSVAAKMVAEGRARVASDDETKQFYEIHSIARQEAEALAAAQRMQVTLVPHSEYRPKTSRGPKE